MKKLLAALVAAVLAATVVMPTADAKGERLPLAIVVRMAQPTTAEGVADLIDDKEIVEVLPVMPERNIFLVTTDGEIEVDDDGKVKIHGGAKKWFDKVLKDDDVVWATPTAGPRGDDAGFHAWGFHAWGFHAWGFHAWPDQMFLPAASAERFAQPAFEPLALSQVHQQAQGDAVKVAVLDTGIDMTHPEFAGKLLPGLDLVGLDFDPSEEFDGVDNDGDGNVDEAWGHGTFVAGVISQIAPQAQILPIRVLDADGRAEQWAVIEAIEYAIEQDVDVINMSFGLPDKAKDKALKDALKRAAKEHDIVVIAAAGNQSDDTKHFPAGEKDVLGVAALDRAGQNLAPFSNFGKWVELAAPGADIISAVPGGGWGRWGGTSVATPIVTGVAALAFDVAPGSDAKDIVKALREGARSMSGKRAAEDGVLDALASFERLGVDLEDLAGSALLPMLDADTDTEGTRHDGT